MWWLKRKSSSLDMMLCNSNGSRTWEIEFNLKRRHSGRGAEGLEFVRLKYAAAHK